MLKPVIFIACALPLVFLVVDAFTGELGANPVETITHATGDWTLRLLLITLSMTPLRGIAGWSWPLRLRRMLGLYSFFYALLHLLTYLWLDQFFDVQAILHDIVKRPFITVGMAAFLMLIPLAMTSTNAMMRRLGRHWKRLHRLVYLVAIGGVLHYLWLVKADVRDPLIYGALLALLLGFRLLPKRVLPLRRYLAQRLERQGTSKRPMATRPASVDS